jgi:hypothetical protein
MVEYAGDYLTQNNSGVTTAVGEDGQLDYDLVGGARKIRWYGLTRSTDGSADEPSLVSPPAKPQVIHPLYKHLQAVPALNVSNLPFEKINANAFPQTKYTNMDSYTCAWSPDDIQFDPSNPDPNNNTITWLKAFPSRTFLPWLVRITIRVDDPYGRIPDGQTMEYVFKLPRPSL